jgi:PQQ-dependent catabolism-associated CXXCW motif protein
MMPISRQIVACAFSSALLLTTNGVFASGEKTDAAVQMPRGVDAKTGFRMGRYRGPTPDTIPGGTVVDDQWMLSAAKDPAIALIDVFPPKGLGPDLFDGSWRNSEKRDSIAGATWLPEVGRGFLEPEAKEYLARNLKSISKADKSKPMVFFCTADCWQGWNAARRAILLGYTQVHWYPQGTDGWLENGGKVVNVEPVNFLGPD